MRIWDVHWWEKWKQETESLVEADSHRQYSGHILLVNFVLFLIWAMRPFPFVKGRFVVCFLDAEIELKLSKLFLLILSLKFAKSGLWIGDIGRDFIGVPVKSLCKLFPLRAYWVCKRQVQIQWKPQIDLAMFQPKSLFCVFSQNLIMQHFVKLSLHVIGNLTWHLKRIGNHSRIMLMTSNLAEKNYLLENMHPCNNGNCWTNFVTGSCKLWP